MRLGGVAEARRICRILAFCLFGLCATVVAFGTWKALENFNSRFEEGARDWVKRYDEDRDVRLRLMRAQAEALERRR